MKVFLTAILIAAMTGLAFAGGEGRDGTTIRSDYTASFQVRVSSYSPNLWRLDADSSEILQALDDALLEVSKLLGATERADSIFMDSSLWYDLPSDFQSMARVSYKDPGGLGEIGLDSIIFRDIGKNTAPSNDHPAYFTLWNRQIYFDRNNYLQDTMFIYYNSYPAILASDADTSNVSMYYFNIVVDQAILFFYSGRVGAAVPQILALADRRLAKAYADMNVEYKSVVPDVR